MRTIPNVIARIRAEFLEMPGMTLTAGQVERFCGVERHVCRVVLDALVAEHFLCVKPNGAYTRLSDGRMRPRGAEVDFDADTRVAVAS